ncbi:hypothetical protein [Methylophaga frappieri]|uniref:hypothetical protein n=1 Tax=Methylophaga frappieri (strain ATCC BAA-2434 / DSM 25690 / JAM7) TaxID=754477 RepID=UPI000308403F|nr:hypothetical protein [Methylophaga frappieri]
MIKNIASSLSISRVQWSVPIITDTAILLPKIDEQDYSPYAAVSYANGLLAMLLTTPYLQFRINA